MCGIFGFYLKRKLDDNDVKQGIQSTNKLSHRGPDNNGYWHNKDDGIFLGHTRLSILDQSSKSNQPFYKNNSQLVFNGEIYNHLTLKKELEISGSKFQTTSDTEVLSEILHQKGEDALDTIDGMFSFAFYNNKSLLLAIDYFGEKPLYWHSSDEGFFFSSEPEPLIKLLNLPVRTDSKMITEFLTLGYIVSPYTAFKGLFRCSPASMLLIQKGDKIKESKYSYHPSQCFERGRVKKPSEEQLDKITDILINSIDSRTISDVPVGLFLSSGIDSSLIAAILTKELRRKDITSFTVKYDKNLIHDESNGAAKIANFLDMNHIIVDSKNYNSDYNMEHLNKIFGEPNYGVTAFSIEKMSVLAKHYFSVALTGTGGDEIFFGYGKYPFLYKYRYLLANNFSKLLLESFSKKLSLLGNRLKTIAALSSVEVDDVLLSLKNNPFFSDDLVYKKFKDSNLAYFKDLTPENIVIQQRSFDLSIHMPNIILPSMDRGSMQSGLEARSPFLSKELLQYVATIDYRSFVKFEQKGVLRDILKRYIPEKYTSSKKRGFSFPISILINDMLTRNMPIKNNDFLKYSLKKMDIDSRWSKLVLRILILENYVNTNNKQ
jgi:asparagine synthase (glutamine-hydrolysing)